MRIRLLTLAIAGLVVVLGVASYGQKQRSLQILWEYKIVANADEHKLNELGDQGWELISVQMIKPPALTRQSATDREMGPNGPVGPSEAITITPLQDSGNKSEVTLLYLKRRK